MTQLKHTAVTEAPFVTAPDGSDVRILADLAGGSMIQCTLPAGAVSKPIYHRTVEELWYCLAGQGRMWRSIDKSEETVDLVPGVSLNIPKRCGFQFRSDGTEPLQLVIVTIPPWPGEDEAVYCQGPWTPTV